MITEQQEVQEVETAPVSNDNPVTGVSTTDGSKSSVIEFRGRILGEIDDVVITPALIEEKSKPLLALTIKGVHDTAGAEEIKKAITKAVKMRTLIEGQAEPVIKKINAEAKKHVQAVRDAAEPIYVACRATQNTLQATYDAWQAQVDKARREEEEALAEKTTGRDNKMFAVGMLASPVAFVGYGRSIAKEALYAMDDERFTQLLEELEGLQVEAGVGGDEPVTTTGYHSVYSPAAAEKTYDSVYDKRVAGVGRIIIHTGEIAMDVDALLINDRVGNSNKYVTILK